MHEQEEGQYAFEEDFVDEAYSVNCENNETNSLGSVRMELKNLSCPQTLRIHTYSVSAYFERVYELHSMWQTQNLNR